MEIAVIFISGIGMIPNRCCVRGAVLEVNERLIKDPTLLNKRVSLFIADHDFLLYLLAIFCILIERTCQGVILLTRVVTCTVTLISVRFAEK